MCLSTAYLDSKSDDRVAAKFVVAIDVDGDTITLTDVMGMKMDVTGRIAHVDLTGGVVIIATEIQ